MVRGSCLCGDVAWEAAGQFDLMSHCHCSMCRKTHGTAFATWVATETSGFRMVRGGDGVARYESSPGFHRCFCARCGSSVPRVPEDGEPGGERVFVPAGCLDDDPGVRPLSHIFVGSKAPWFEITDDLPRFDAYPPGIGGEVKRGARAPATREGALRGSCLCGAVAFELDAKPALLVHCHCSRCRKARAAAHNSNMFVREGELRWVRGEDHVTQFELPEADVFGTRFCSTCGSMTPRPGEQSGAVPVSGGALDDDPGDLPVIRIFCGSKAPWFQITGDQPAFDAYAPGRS
jgi:hypothetical protein